MRVLIDCTQIVLKKAGVGVYALNLVEGLSRIQNPDFQLYILAQDDDPDFLQFRSSTRVFTVRSRWFRLLPFRLLLEQLYIPWLTRKHQIDVVHSLHYSFPLLPTRARKIVTIHDMTFFLMPEVHLGTKVVYFRFFITAASKLADSIIFVSNSTKADWEERFPDSTVQRCTVPLGKSPAFNPRITPDRIASALSKYEISRPYVLYIGTIEPRKNLVRLVRAFATIAEQFPSYSLVIAGAKGWGYAEVFSTVTRFDLTKRVRFTGFIDEDDKPALLAGSDVFAYISLYEGFGIPVLEALACGTPTLTSEVSSLPEITGESAILVNPRDEGDIALKLRTLLSDSQIRERLSIMGLRQSQLFLWQRTVQMTKEVYFFRLNGLYKNA